MREAMISISIGMDMRKQPHLQLLPVMGNIGLYKQMKVSK